MTILHRPTTARAFSGRVVTGPSRHRPVVSDRWRVVLAAVEAHGTHKAAGEALGISGPAVSTVLSRAAAALDTDTKSVVRRARRQGLLDDVPATLPTPGENQRTRERVPRGDGTFWSPRSRTPVDPWCEGSRVLALRTADIPRARRIVAARWATLHGGEPPATGTVVWRRLEAAPTHPGGQRIERAEPLWPRAFPAVLFTPEGG